MKYYIRLVILFALLAGSVRYAAAEVRLAGIFADHMILQRERPIQIWGWAFKPVIADHDCTIQKRPRKCSVKRLTGLRNIATFSKAT